MSELRVRLIDERGGVTDVISPNGMNKTPQEVGNESKLPTSKDSARSTKAISYATMYAHQTIDYVATNAAKWQGSTIGATRVSNAKSLIGLGMSALTNPIATLLMGAFSVGTTAINYNIERSIDNKRVSANLKRAGYNSVGEMVGRRGQ